MNEFDKEEHTEDIWYSQIRDYEKYSFCMELPLGFSLKPISKHKG